jgi:hypothetical protein
LPFATGRSDYPADNPWLAGRAAQLRGWQLFFATSIAGALGLVMIALKDLVLIHLH